MLLNTNILLVNLSEELSSLIKKDLEESGFHGVATCSLEEVSSELKNLTPRLLIIDRNSTGAQGLSFCRKIRAENRQILILLMLLEETLEERVVCLESGADDYFLLPYYGKDFLNLVRFYLKPVSEIMEQLSFGDLILDLSNHSLLLSGKIVELTMKEFELLKYLMSNPDEILSRNQILENVWGINYMGESNVIEVYIRYLRLKLEAQGQKRIIQTVRGVGYVLRES
jgi:DNA-binding response OmpR family regulator